ncbi:MAG: ATPase, T2SS/T4P/T4SS family [Planctomycetota bacterium]|nr:ATPase, T2SS/T4P/T4SS family [Planctomycetota bacterium]
MKRPAASRTARIRRSAPAPHTDAPAQAPPADAGELLDVDQALALLKSTRPTFYRWLRMGRIKGLKVGRQWRFYRADLERFIQGQEPRIGLGADIGPLLQALRARLRSAGARDALPETDEPAAQAVRLMIRLGLALRASGLHLEPLYEGEGRSRVALRYRMDGVLHEVAACDARLLPALIEQWKRMAACDLNEKRLPQDGRILCTELGKAADLRVCFLPAVIGESLTARLLVGDVAADFSLDALGYAPADKERLLRHLRAPWGLILLTGPTGTGKTTTLYACLRQLIKPEVKAISIENPVEYILGGVTQVQINPSAGLTYSRALRAALRSDPNVICLTEICDCETLLVVIQAVLVGQLVLTTLHTDSAAAALVRMVNIGADPFLVTDATRLIVSQRLVRVLCPKCKRHVNLGAGQRAQVRELARQCGTAWEGLPHRDSCEPVGCPHCAQTGYRGRVAIVETLEVTAEIAAALRRGAPVNELQALAIRQGMTPLLADGLRRASAGETSVEEVLRIQPGTAAVQ